MSQLVSKPWKNIAMPCMFSGLSPREPHRFPCDKHSHFLHQNVHFSVDVHVLSTTALWLLFVLAPCVAHAMNNVLHRKL